MPRSSGAVSLVTEDINHCTSTNIVADIAKGFSKHVDVCIENTAVLVHDVAMLKLNTVGRVVIVGIIALANRFGYLDIGLRNLHRRLIIRADIRNFRRDDIPADCEVARAELLGKFKQRFLKNR